MCLLVGRHLGLHFLVHLALLPPVPQIHRCRDSHIFVIWPLRQLWVIDIWSDRIRSECATLPYTTFANALATLCVPILQKQGNSDAAY